MSYGQEEEQAWSQFVNVPATSLKRNLMKKVSKADLKENTEIFKGCQFLEPREWLDNAIIGKCAVTQGIIYDYDDLVEAFMERDGIDFHQAAMAVDFTTERDIAHMLDPKPVIHRQHLQVEEDEDEDE